MLNNIAYLPRFGTSKISRYVSIEDIFNLIKTNPNENSIWELRKYPKGHDTYRKIKSELPVCAFNAVFNRFRDKEYLIALTGYVYLDLDTNLNIETDFNLLKECPYINAMWRSVGGKGIGLIIKTDNYNQENFLDYWLSLDKFFTDKYGFPVDAQTKDIARCNVISFDPNLYFNNTSITYSIETNFTKESNQTNDDFIKLNTKNRFLDMYGKFDINTLYSYSIFKTGIDRNLFKENEKCIFLNEGIDVRKFFAKNSSIKEGNRNKILLQAGYTIKFNLPDINFDEMYTLIQYLNYSKCTSPLTAIEIKSIVNSVINKFNEGRLLTKKQHYFLNPDIDMDKSEKMIEIQKKRKENNLCQILDSIKDYIHTNKLTQKDISEISGKSLRTIKRRWSEIKKYIDGNKNLNEI